MLWASLAIMHKGLASWEHVRYSTCQWSCFTVDHAKNCASGGFPTLRRNELREFTTGTLYKVCYDVAIKPVLQPLSGESSFCHDQCGGDARAVPIPILYRYQRYYNFSGSTYM